MSPECVLERAARARGWIQGRSREAPRLELLLPDPATNVPIGVVRKTASGELSSSVTGRTRGTQKRRSAGRSSVCLASRTGASTGGIRPGLWSSPIHTMRKFHYT